MKLLDNKYRKRRGILSLSVVALLAASFASVNHMVHDNAALAASPACANLSITGLATSGDDGNVPANAIDNNLGTRWSDLGAGSWIRADLGQKGVVCSIDIAWYRGDQRTNNFVIAVSEDGSSYTNVYTGTSSGTTTSAEKYSFAEKTARYVRVTVNGNSQNSWASITEIDVNGYTSAACANLSITGLGASGDDGHVPANAIDNNLNTRWSDNGVGSWIRADLGQQKAICSVDIAWYRGNTRTNDFAIDVSADGTSYTNVYTGTSSGTTTSAEKYSFAEKTARYVRVTVNGNSQNSWASITEIDVNGYTSGAPSPTPTPTPDTTAPSVKITNPLANANIPVGTITVQGTAADNSGGSGVMSVGVRLNSNAYATATPKAPGDWSTWTVSVSVPTAGPHSLVSRATDRAGNEATNSINVNAVASSGGTVDRFGIKELYPTKTGADEWFMDMNNPNVNRDRFDVREDSSITKNSDGSWKIGDTQIRMNTYTKGGYDASNIETYQQPVLERQGYMQDPSDWKNVEMTGYVKLNDYSSNAYFSWYARSGRHTHNTGPNGENQECEGTGVKPRIYFNGNTASVKEIWHNEGYAVTNRITGSTDPLQGKWIGIKTVIYDVKMPDGSTAVKQELWVDEKNDKVSWRKVNEYLDKGGWEANSNICGGRLDQKVLWGGPMATFRWDNATDVDFKWLSVREIQAP